MRRRDFLKLLGFGAGSVITGGPLLDILTAKPLETFSEPQPIRSQPLDLIWYDEEFDFQSAGEKEWQAMMASSPLDDWKYYCGSTMDDVTGPLTRRFSELYDATLLEAVRRSA